MSNAGLRVLVAADARSFHTERYVEELRRQGCEVLVVSMEQGTIAHHRLKSRRPRKTQYILAAREMRQLVHDFRPDVVNPHFASGYGHLVSRATRRGFPPVLLHVWGSDILIVPKKSFLHRYKTRAALEAADAVTGDSEYLLDEAARIGRLARREMIVWGIEKRYLAQRRKDNGWSAPLRVIGPRSQEAVYDNAFIVNALAEPVNDGKIELTLAGFGALLDDIKAQSQRLTGGRVRFYDRLSRDAYMALLAGQDVYLSAARSDSSPASMLEAMGLGLIPVVGDIPGIREWIDERAGYRFPLRDHAALRGVFEHLLTGNDDMAALRGRNVKRIEREAVFEDNIARTIAIMAELAGTNAA